VILWPTLFSDTQLTRLNGSVGILNEWQANGLAGHERFGLTPGRQDSLLLRCLLFAFVLVIACPIRYSSWQEGDIDTTWRFALNYAESEGLSRDVVFTYGPLGFLACPLNMGWNLTFAFFIQAGLWVLVAWTLASFFFRTPLPLCNLASFAVFFGLSGPMFWFNGAGLENLLVAVGLLLLVNYHFYGSRFRFILALCIVGVAALVKLTAGLILALSLVGFLLERIILIRRKALWELTLAVAVPISAFGVLSAIFIPSVDGLARYLRSNIELLSGYTSAMSLGGPRIDLWLALQTIVLLGSLIGIQAAVNGRAARFYTFLLIGPVFLTFKQGFVRPDFHVIIFFSFAALAIGLISLTVPLSGRDLTAAMMIGLIFFICWASVLDHHLRWGETLNEVTGLRGLKTTWAAVHFGRLHQELDSARIALAAKSPIDPEIRTIIGDQAVAPLSVRYAQTFAAGLQIEIYPVLQRYSAYTPYLDRLNAGWIREKGPIFLLFDGETLNERDVWAESPATWFEIYRWYNTRYLSPFHLLLERRASPRFSSLEKTQSFAIDLTSELRLPASENVQFWNMTCSASYTGMLRKLLFRVSPVTVSILRDGRVRTARVIPELLVSPVIASMPGTLAQLARVFDPETPMLPTPETIVFGGGTSNYSRTCQVEIFQPQ
jgi:hypothetical protein